jgi:hypothetical protein
MSISRRSAGGCDRKLLDTTVIQTSNAELEIRNKGAVFRAVLGRSAMRRNTSTAWKRCSACSSGRVIPLQAPEAHRLYGRAATHRDRDGATATYQLVLSETLGTITAQRPSSIRGPGRCISFLLMSRRCFHVGALGVVTMIARLAPPFAVTACSSTTRPSGLIRRN